MAEALSSQGGGGRSNGSPAQDPHILMYYIIKLLTSQPSQLNLLVFGEITKSRPPQRENRPRTEAEGYHALG